MLHSNIFDISKFIDVQESHNVSAIKHHEHNLDWHNNGIAIINSDDHEDGDGQPTGDGDGQPTDFDDHGDGDGQPTDFDDHGGGDGQPTDSNDHGDGNGQPTDSNDNGDGHLMVHLHWV